MKLKSSASFLILLAIAFCFVNNSYAQTQFEGKVTFKAFDEGQPHSMEYYAKGSKIRFDTNEEGQQGQIIWDTSKKEFMVVMPEQKMFMVMQVPESQIKSDISSEISKNAQFTKTGETKKILGYTAVKLVYKDGDDKGEAWMTQELGTFKLFDNPMQKDEEKAQWQKDFESGGYFPLEVYENGKKVFEVTSIEKKSLDGSMFEAPSGYQKMDMPKMH
jgi:hypothetical protein